MFYVVYLVCLSLSLAYLSICLSVHLSVYPVFVVSVLSVYLSIVLSVHLSIFSLIYLTLLLISEAMSGCLGPRLHKRKGSFSADFIISFPIKMEIRG